MTGDQDSLADGRIDLGDKTPKTDIEIKLCLGQRLFVEAGSRQGADTTRKEPVPLREKIKSHPAAQKAVETERDQTARQHHDIEQRDQYRFYDLSPLSAFS